MGLVWERTSLCIKGEDGIRERKVPSGRRSEKGESQGLSDSGGVYEGERFSWRGGKKEFDFGSVSRPAVIKRERYSHATHSKEVTALNARNGWHHEARRTTGTSVKRTSLFLIKTSGKEGLSF